MSNIYMLPGYHPADFQRCGPTMYSVHALGCIYGLCGKNLHQDFYCVEHSAVICKFDRTPEPLIDGLTSCDLLRESVITLD